MSKRPKPIWVEIPLTKPAVYSAFR